MKSKQIVIISAVFFPRNSPRANRTTELAKEFARQGHNVTVYSGLGDYDYSLFEKTHNLKIKDLGKRKFVTLNSDVKTVPHSFLTKVGSKLFHGFIEFPDIEWSFKVANVLKGEKNIDLLITVAVPFPIHWGAAYAEKNFTASNIRTWVADCGDPYMGNQNFKKLFYFKYIEKWFCRKVDYITVPTEEAVSAYYQEFHNKIKVIPQGFNFDDYSSLPQYHLNPVPTFIYAGAFYDKIRDPRPFLDYLTSLTEKFKFIIYTKNQKIVQPYKTQLKNKLEIKDYIPRQEIIREFAKADFLINFENAENIQTPSKLIDYALAKRPVLSIPSLKINKKQVLAFLNRNYSSQKNIENIDRYNITHIADNFLKLAK